MRRIGFWLVAVLVVTTALPAFAAGDKLQPQRAPADIGGASTAFSASGLKVPQKPGTVAALGAVEPCKQTNTMDWSGAPYVKYYARVECAPGSVPANITFTVYKANVNTPYNYRYARRDATYYCWGKNPCVTEPHTIYVDTTMKLRVLVSTEAIVPGGTAYGTGEVAWWFNDAGRAYPKVTDSTGREVPFPNGPYTVCDDNPSQRPTCWRDPSFRTKLLRAYRDNGIPMPPSPNEAHHIKPLEFGGGNAPWNGVFLPSWQHDLFTAWFVRFNPRPWW